MKPLRRLYGYLRAYKVWAVVAFGSMIVFALTQTVLAALAQPLFDDVLTPPAAVSQPKSRIPSAVENLPIVGPAKAKFDAWWDVDAATKPQRVLTVILLVFLLRAITSFFSEYSFQKVGLSTVRDLRNQLYERMIHQSHRFFTERPTGEMVSRVVSDAASRPVASRPWSAGIRGPPRPPASASTVSPRPAANSAFATTYLKSHDHAAPFAAMTRKCSGSPNIDCSCARSGTPAAL